MSFLSNINTSHASVLYSTGKGMNIARSQVPIPGESSILELQSKLDEHKGVLFSSAYHFPGRYSRWDIGFINPPLELTSKKNNFQIKALNDRGEVVIAYLLDHLTHPDIHLNHCSSSELTGSIKTSDEDSIKEENRTKRPSIFTLLRTLESLFHIDDEFIGLYGAFGFDLVLQFEHYPLNKERDADHNDLQLYLPDELLVVDLEKNKAFKLNYEFTYGKLTTEGLPHSGIRYPYQMRAGSGRATGYADKKGDYAELVRKAKDAFVRGDLFEVVPSRVLTQKCSSRPSQVFQRLQKINPSPYGFLIHLNNEEFLIGCSPEMFVRVDGATVETCPISGTIRRKGSVIEDAEQIKTLLGSEKEESELTMCTDVDRNDKSRICVPGSVEVVGRRQIEAYSHLFHTVDHIKGQLKEGFDAIDAFISHMWAVTITGAPKLEAMSWIERHEKTARGWYGGAVGWIGFNGNMNTGLTLRCLRLQNGEAQIRVGATLLYDSDPENEEQETLTKAGALIESLNPTLDKCQNSLHEQTAARVVSRPLHLLFVDHEDSFVHTLSSYFQSLGAKITVLRSPAARKLIRSGSEPIDLVVLSPGPGRPERFKMDETIRLCLEHSLPIFGICLGLQGIVSYFGGSLDILPVPAHGKSSIIVHDGCSALFKEVPRRFKAGRYHSICVDRLPNELIATAKSEDHVIMAIEHRSLPITAVQFHPESIMTLDEQVGMKILENVLQSIRLQPAGNR
ncbi:anthranilate synthase component I [Sporolactobacillus laevolacticus]|uniref:Anthranilate synthase n=1 Tax=Sporolactobacillus laevolacticus DSM 442 TaxID=1395513 RepID=V6IY41_9BACL|nr:anthranilate synthase component I [Sporolactobacillus laevolacticus]EST12307.1 anthranilate synthase subunit I [Sporolactobacillus laevolacticus DSM 442]